MRYLGIPVNIEFGGRNFLLVGEVRNAGLYGSETVSHRNLLKGIVRRCQQECDKYNDERQDSSSQYKQLFGGNPSDAHHQINSTEEKHSRRIVFRQDQSADYTGDDHDALECFRAGSVFILPFREDKGGNNHNGHLRYLRGLELDAHERHPACGAVDTVTGDNSHQHDEGKQPDGEG